MTKGKSSDEEEERRIFEEGEITPMKDGKSTLVKYDNPVLISSVANKNIMRSLDETTESPGFPVKPKIPGLTISSVAGKDSELTKEEMEQILEIIFPPIQWEEEDKVWMQKVSSTPATRLDVESLEEKLEMRMHERQVREIGISPIRHSLFVQAFDELIRQVTIDCAERGLLLLRLRDEIRMTIAAYEAITISAIQNGQDAANEAESLADGSGESLQEVIDEKNKFEWKAQEIIMKTELLEREYHESKKAEGKRHLEEMKLLKLANQQLQILLDNVNAYSKEQK